jgi:hypothetical protein
VVFLSPSPLSLIAHKQFEVSRDPGAQHAGVALSLACGLAALANVRSLDAHRRRIAAAATWKEQRRVELIRRAWTKERTYIAEPTRGKLASLDPGLIVTPPAGLEAGYVPIALRQERRPNKR